MRAPVVQTAESAGHDHTRLILTVGDALRAYVALWLLELPGTVGPLREAGTVAYSVFELIDTFMAIAA